VLGTWIQRVGSIGASRESTTIHRNVGYLPSNVIAYQEDSTLPGCW